MKSLLNKSGEGVSFTLTTVDSSTLNGSTLIIECDGRSYSFPEYRGKHITKGKSITFYGDNIERDGPIAFSVMSVHNSRDGGDYGGWSFLSPSARQKGYRWQEI
jgi:hypothetical protein